MGGLSAVGYTRIPDPVIVSLLGYVGLDDASTDGVAFPYHVDKRKRGAPAPRTGVGVKW